MDKRAQNFQSLSRNAGAFSFQEITMTDEQTQLLRQILEELKALRELNERAVQGGCAMAIQDE